MKNVKNVNFLQVDNKNPQLVNKPGAIVLPSNEAFEKLGWTRKYFREKPKEGYFIWVEKQISYPLSTCITICSPNVSQKLMNLIVVDKEVETEMYSICNAIEKNLSGVHISYSKIVLKENSKLKIRHFHSWGKKDKVDASLDFVLEKGAELSYSYKCLKTPLKLKTKSNIYLEENSVANLMTTILAKNSEVDMQDATFLKGEKSNGISRIRLVGDKNSKIIARSKIVAEAGGTGHLDCMGLLTADNSSINAIPELINKNKEAFLTHEASVGRIAEESLNYLRSRGLTEDEAIDLIVTGFLGGEEPLVIGGRVISSKRYM
ncbi:SufD family Fe-S cluster assembly protein [Candidatus Shapirobacteria bacterium]|nr:SufD family Fe-S cluster assembly protein [Candidatus Shapirobacteria bacterium]